VRLHRRNADKQLRRNLFRGHPFAVWQLYLILREKVLDRAFINLVDGPRLRDLTIGSGLFTLFPLWLVL
jgi:hypothetical protein